MTGLETCGALRLNEKMPVDNNAVLDAERDGGRQDRRHSVIALTGLALIIAQTPDCPITNNLDP